MNNLLSFLIGALISIMIMINGILSGSVGNYLSVVIIHIVGLIAMILALILNKAKVNFSKDIPLYLYSAGAIGVFTVLFNNIGFSVLGVSMPLALGLLGQSLTSIIIDHFGWLGMKVVKFDIKKSFGLLLITSGIIIMTIF
ncbi:EamA-like transporter family protein [Defluviitalea raffinosedens]|uniref:EamA-like transporter family protein n=1 Tax=Defluviitalea raffinosedens TaxID=1450156 RepID=A0A7C8HEV6_9FIRM|nr:DMT family transporter [Defluviitalea raffinosedens]KAE9634934.1 EamA-like transporter family protein [Defluviitalea raffinosedens]